MKKIIGLIFLFIVIRSFCYSQDLKFKSDSVMREWHEGILHNLDTARQDTSRVLLIAQLANYYKFNLPDSALFYGYKALALARQIKFPSGEVTAVEYITLALKTLGNDSKALQINLQALKIAEKNNLINDKALLLSELGLIYNEFKNYPKALDLFRESKALFDSLHDFTYSALAQNLVGETFLKLNQVDSALYYCQSAYENSVQLNVEWLIYGVLLNLGRIQNKKGNTDLALTYFRQSLSMAGEANNYFNSYFSIAQLYKQMNMPDSCIYYAKKSLEIVRGKGFYSNIIDANILLSSIYEKIDLQKALQYSKMAITYKDSLYNLGKATSFENFIAFDEQERQYEIDTAKEAYRSQIKQYVSIAGLMVFLLIVFILYRNNRHKQKAKVKIEKAYSDLKSTQAQLIQSEKMASLGELTAGIAHEIQNPLNFVNNFSEVNKELIAEMREEIAKGNFEEANALAKDVEDNEEKINQHGKRADAIVKGMLQHSQTSAGHKESVDINKLADEYLRLAYHGIRGKNKLFNATLKTDFDDTIGNINIIPQDIGRVLLNLYNNAFYAVSQKHTSTGSALKEGKEYEPTVSVSTKKIGDKVEVRVKDNGNGIPQKIIDKIFQPFFTTKPTGQGTGLGLSLAYDIIKAHGGEIKVEAKEARPPARAGSDGDDPVGRGEGTEFVMHLPLA